MRCRVSCGSAIAALVALVGGQSTGDAQQRLIDVEERVRVTETAPVPTPRTAAGRPDLSGVWVRNRLGPANVDAAGNITVLLAARDGGAVEFERDQGVRKRMDPNRPLYKPEFWDKVQYLDENGDISEDPAFGCKPEGVPRMGPPHKIVQTTIEVIFLYSIGDAAAGSGDYFRVIPIDGRPFPPDEELVGTYLGVSRGRWEGDTLVVESIGFNEDTWLDFPGYFHTYKMKVTERLRREGNVIHYQTTVEDPDVLMRPWVMNPRVLTLNPDPHAMLEEPLPCVERDRELTVTKERG